MAPATATCAAPSRPLDGVRVVDLTRLLPGGYCTLVLAELGAEVIRVEDPRGGDLVRSLPPFAGGVSVYDQALNRNKRSVALDLRQPEGNEVLRRIVAGADVLVESFRPRTAARLGVRAADLRAMKPRLIHCSITGFGQRGPSAERAGHDLTYVALSGLFEVEQPEGPRRGGRKGNRREAVHPYRVPQLLVADVGGAWAAATGIVAALFQRERTGQGASIDISLHDAALSWLTFPAAATVQGREGGLRITGRHACYNLYGTADDRAIALAAIEEKFWETFCQRVERPDWTRRQFTPGQEDLRREVAALFGSQPLAYWMDLFRDVDTCLAPVNTIREALADAQTASRGTIASDAAPRAIRTPVVFLGSGSGTPATRLPVRPAPALGADTDEVLRAAGYDEAKVREMRERGVVL
jgi:alpha-methylacyl-CoA racemase